MLRLLLISCCALFIFSRCTKSSGTDNSSKHPQNNAPAPVEVDYAAATADMARTIAKAFNQIDHSKASFFVEEKRIAMFREQIQNPDISTQLTARSYYGFELFNAGRIEQAIVELEAVLKDFEKYKIEGDSKLQMKRLLAVAYLRLAEVENCINVRNDESCIFPISPKGQYKMTQGSETCMRLCKEVLQEFPNDPETIFILNLAAMTIGKYPAGVPSKWRLSEASIRKGAHFTRFRDISMKVGIKGTNLAGGVCTEDFDNDGWIDILTSSWGPNDPLKFWKNTGQGNFVDASAEMGLSGINGGLHMVHSDINNDGLADVLVLRGAWLRDQGKIPNSLLLNLGNGKFADITKSAKVLTFCATQAGTFADFNLDGWIDLFVGNESGRAYAYKNELYLNNKDNTFRNVIDKIGVQSEGFVKGVFAGDVNNDGWPDIYVSRLGQPNLLLLHKGLDAEGIPQFQDIGQSAGVQEPIASFPTWMWDYDNDGWLDIFVSGYGEPGALKVANDFVLNAAGEKLVSSPKVYHNKGNNTFEDVSLSMGMTETIYTMGCNYGDLDADGYLDFYLGTGAPEYSSVVPNKMFRNNAGKHFDDITTAGGFGHIQKGHGVSFADFDHDGDEDLFESLGGAYQGDVYEDILFENPIGQDKSWVVLQLRGTKSNRMAVGARVKITAKGPDGTHVYYRTVSTGASFGSNSLQLETGLDDATAIQEIEVIWPVLARTKQVFRDVQLNKYVLITEGNDSVEYPDVHPVKF